MAAPGQGVAGVHGAGIVVIAIHEGIASAAARVAEVEGARVAIVAAHDRVVAAGTIGQAGVE